MSTTNPESPVAAHSPLPWFVRPNSPETMMNCVEPVWISDNDGKTVIVVSNVGHGSASKEEHERAALIVHRVNAFDALVAALDNAVESLETTARIVGEEDRCDWCDSSHGHRPDCVHIKNLESARTALAAAKQQP